MPPTAAPSPQDIKQIFSELSVFDLRIVTEMLDAEWNARGAHLRYVGQGAPQPTSEAQARKRSRGGGGA